MHKNCLLLWDRMGDYHRARWRALREAHDGDVWAADWCASDDLYRWEATADERHVRLQGPGPGGWWRCVRLIRREKIQVVAVPGYGRFGYILLLIWLRVTGRKSILFAESWYPGAHWKDRLKGAFLRRTVDGFLVSGQRARDHFHHRLGIADDCIRTGYSVVDNEHFRGQKSEVGSRKSEVGGQESEKRVLLCVARFAPEKGLDVLLEAFSRSELHGKGWSLELVGGGPLEAELRDQAGPGVMFRDWVSYAELPALYARASVVVLPSRFEPWGLVVNEAMAAGRPVLASDAVGAVPDLVTADTGWVVPSENVDALQCCLDSFAEIDEECLWDLGKSAQDKVADTSPQTWARRCKELMV